MTARDDTLGDSLRLHQFERLPDGFFDCEASDLHEIVPGPSLIHLSGQRPDTLFVSILLHGNEDTGLKAMQALLGRYRERRLPRGLSLFLGNLPAAKAVRRRLDDQADYNRCWPGTECPGSKEAALMREVCRAVARRRLFASIDIHNNTGLNPHYACVNRLDRRFLQLARLFGRTIVYFVRPRGVQSMAMAALCPAVTLECGRVGQQHGTEHAAEFVEACLRLDHIPDQPIPPQDIDLFHTVAQVKVPERISFSFDNDATDILFDPRIDHFNFREVPAGTVLGTVADPQRANLYACSETGQDLAGEYFRVEGNRLCVSRPIMPAMLTLNERVIRQDCLCYLMERLPAPGA